MIEPIHIFGILMPIPWITVYWLIVSTLIWHPWSSSVLDPVFYHRPDPSCPGWWGSVCHFERCLWQFAASSVTFNVNGWCNQYYSETWTGWPFLRWRLVDLSPSGSCLVLCPVPTVTVCIDDISSWMSSDHLKINTVETDWARLSSWPSSTSVRLLWLMLTLKYLMKSPVSMLCSIALWHLRQTWKSVSGVAFINCNNWVLFAALCPTTPQRP